MEDIRPQVRRVLLITLLLNILVLLVKLVVGLWTGSLSLIADALHSVTDSFNNVLGLVAIRFASPYPDREHPYGHQKFEAIAALSISAFLGMACLEILKGVIDRVTSGAVHKVDVSAPALWLMIVVLGMNIIITFYERRVGNRIGSSILIADAQHTMSDVWITIIVIAGLIGVWCGELTGMKWLQWIDVVLALPVAALVFWSGWKVIASNLPMLVDEMAIAPETIDAIARQVPGVINCHDIASRGVLGRQIFIEMHMIVAPTDVESAHQITELVEDLLHEHFDPVRIAIHVEPPNYKSDRVTYE
ncbi:cation diffusion facilitator family transporter [Pseudanabaena sp. PCC 6802]|uniref:cation diffusion facilitator family transporter n=1 Tax=Pseudanabaena sp. PCC 6802 TaxID=118173 RepID=UPI00036695CB|nr:cation diffusion facilitator family transporter [Pseudanabaena sp. PCC 6802]